jgi:hypothetical protein
MTITMIDQNGYTGKKKSWATRFSVSRKIPRICPRPP